MPLAKYPVIAEIPEDDAPHVARPQAFYAGRAYGYLGLRPVRRYVIDPARRGRASNGDMTVPAPLARALPGADGD